VEEGRGVTDLDRSGAEESSSPAQRLPELDDLLRFWDSPLVMLGVGDYEGWFRQVNHGFTAVLGWSAEELTSAPLWEFVHPDDQDEVVESRQKMIDDDAGMRFGFDFRMLCRNGSYRWTRWNAVNQPSDQLLYGVGLDITDLKPPVTDRTVVGTWQWDVPGNTMIWSAELHDVFERNALTYEAFVGRVCEEDRARVGRLLGWSLVSGEPPAFKIRVRHSDGKIWHLHVAGRAEMNADGEPQRLRGIARYLVTL
jgi:PAS domain S-box-containing protein